MSNLIVKMLVLIGTLSLSGPLLADWQSDCQSLENAPSPCTPIQNQVSVLSAYMTPAPFISTTINQFPNGVFPKGTPWGSSSGSQGSSGGDVLPSGGSTSTKSGSSGSTSGGTNSSSGSGTSTTGTGTGTGSSISGGGGGGTFQ